MNGSQEALKKSAAHAALEYVGHDQVIGIGSGSTVAYFIEALADIKQRVRATVASSEASATLLKKYGLPVTDLNTVDELPLYVDGADEFNAHKYLIKGGGGALTREKIVAAVAKQFVCIVDQSKQVDVLGSFPLAIEVIPMARSYVAREIAKMQGMPAYRQGFVTDNGNVILDVHGWKIVNPMELEIKLNQITGVVSHGLFCQRPADVVLIAEKEKIMVI